jgi:hypothetical protein
LTLGHEGAGELNQQLVGKLVESGYAPFYLMRAWTRSCWLYEGPNETLLHDVLAGERKNGVIALFQLRIRSASLMDLLRDKTRSIAQSWATLPASSAPARGS